MFCSTGTNLELGMWCWRYACAVGLFILCLMAPGIKRRLASLQSSMDDVRVSLSSCSSVSFSTFCRHYVPYFALKSRSTTFGTQSSSRKPLGTHTHTHTRLMALFPWLPRWAGTRKVKPIWILQKQESEWQWHQLGHMQVCTLLQTDNHASTPLLFFLQAGYPSCRPTNSVKALTIDARFLPSPLYFLLTSSFCHLISELRWTIRQMQLLSLCCYDVAINDR